MKTTTYNNIFLHNKFAILCKKNDGFDLYASLIFSIVKWVAEKC